MRHEGAVHPSLSGRTLEAQAFRAERVVTTTFKLASEGGYEAVQMREVARGAGVALATLYRYYPSKDVLLYAVIQSQLVQLREDVLSRPPRAHSEHGRAAEVFVRAFRAMERNRGWAHAAASSYQVPKPFRDVPAGASPLRPSDDIALVDVAALAAWGAEHELTDTEALALRMLETLWNGSVIQWLNGQAHGPDVESRLRFAAEHLLAGVTDAAGQVPATR